MSEITQKIPNKVTLTKKDKKLEALMTQIAGMSRQDAVKKDMCVICRKKLTPFRDLLSYKEACITARCQVCQDQIDYDQLNSQGSFVDELASKWCQKGVEITQPAYIPAVDPEFLKSRNIAIIDGKLILKN